ncbi:MAG: methylglyoxal synthase [Chloroflexaceae bacterium]|nr:methylglyoxal synthase [Chloroflexaceae bacterium]
MTSSTLHTLNQTTYSADTDEGHLYAPRKKRIALIAHDNKKRDLMEWAAFNKVLLAQHDLYATGTTGKMLAEVIAAPVVCFRSGPLGGDQQIGSKIAEGGIDLMIFFWDPLEPQPHDPDVRALLRVAVVWNIPVACNRASADFIISSPLMTARYDRTVPDYDYHTERVIENADASNGLLSE